MSSEQIRELLMRYGMIVDELNCSIDVATQKNNELTVAKANVSKNKYNLDLIKEQIMCEKKLIDITK